MEGNKEEAECLFVFCLYLIVAVEVDGKVSEQVIFVHATSRSQDSAADAALIHVVGVDATWFASKTEIVQECVLWFL